jgi:hypothetical protein
MNIRFSSLSPNPPLLRPIRFGGLTEGEKERGRALGMALAYDSKQLKRYIEEVIPNERDAKRKEVMQFAVRYAKELQAMGYG